MQNEIPSIYVKQDFLGNIYSTGSVEQRTIYSNGKSRTVRAYATTSDTVASFTVYAPMSNSEGTAHVFDRLDLKNPQLIALTNSIGTGRDRNSYLEYVVLADAVTISKDADKNEASTATHDPSGRLLNLKFKGGDVTSVIDITKTFGQFLYLGHEPVFKYDDEADAMTEEMIGYDMVLTSSKTKKPYKVKFDSIDVDFTSFRLRDEVTLAHPTFRFYQDSSSTTQGSTISISASHAGKVIAATPETASQQKAKPKTDTKV